LNRCVINIIVGPRRQRVPFWSKSVWRGGCHRKHAIRLLRRPSGIKKASVGAQGKPKRGRKSKCDEPELCQTIRKLWRDTNWMGSKALKASIPAWLPYDEIHYGQLSENTRARLHEISPATIDRLLQHFKKSFGKGLCGTKPGTLLRSSYAISLIFSL
jgi:hypothetical protein